jgi:hypothetical protein
MKPKHTEIRKNRKLAHPALRLSMLGAPILKQPLLSVEIIMESERIGQGQFMKNNLPRKAPDKPALAGSGAPTPS